VDFTTTLPTAVDAVESSDTSTRCDEDTVNVEAMLQFPVPLLQENAHFPPLPEEPFMYELNDNPALLPKSDCCPFVLFIRQSTMQTVLFPTGMKPVSR
jgi:hypothetical protein